MAEISTMSCEADQGEKCLSSMVNVNPEQEADADYIKALDLNIESSTAL